MNMEIGIRGTFEICECHLNDPSFYFYSFEPYYSKKMVLSTTCVILLLFVSAQIPLKQTNGCKNILHNMSIWKVHNCHSFKIFILSASFGWPTGPSFSNGRSSGCRCGQQSAGPSTAGSGGFVSRVLMTGYIYQVCILFFYRMHHWRW